MIAVVVVVGGGGYDGGGNLGGGEYSDVGGSGFTQSFLFFAHSTVASAPIHEHACHPSQRRI